MFNNCIATMIGSLPFLSTQKAVEVVLEHFTDVPAWPQLPKRSYKENMVVQFSENLPGIVINDTEQKIYIDTKKAYNELEKFYEYYLNNDLDYFSISEEYAKGFYHFFEKLSTEPQNYKAIKCQVTGPITFGMAVKTETGRAVFYDEQLRDVIIKHITIKTLWQIKQLANALSSSSLTVIMLLDEPYLAAYGSAFAPISRKEVISSLQEVIRGIKTSFNTITTLIGIHCCANTDWSILLGLDIDILSFDAYSYFDTLLLYTDELYNFIKRGGILAWGIVPNSESIKNETVETLFNKYQKDVTLLINKGCDKNKLLKNAIITPSCGLGNVDEDLVEPILSTTTSLTKKICSKEIII